MVQLIAFIIFILSIGIVSFVLYKKIPMLVSLPEHGHRGIKKPKVIARIEKGLKDTHFNLFERQMFLHKILSKSKVWILKTETKIDTLLHKIRKKSQKLPKRSTRKKEKPPV